MRQIYVYRVLRYWLLTTNRAVFDYFIKINAVNYMVIHVNNCRVVFGYLLKLAIKGAKLFALTENLTIYFINSKILYVLRKIFDEHVMCTIIIFVKKLHIFLLHRAARHLRKYDYK